MSLSDLAKVTNYSKGHLSRVETGRDVPSLTLIRAVDRALSAAGALIATASIVTDSIPVVSAATLSSGEEALIMATADESAKHGRRLGSTNISDEKIDSLGIILERVAIDLLTEPLIPLVLDARNARDEAFTALEGRQYPRQSRRLYAIGARACGLLAVATADRFGLPDPASRHAQVCSAAAELADEPELVAWAASLHSTIAFWQGRYRTAALIAQEARQKSRGGVEMARLACYEARAWARLGDHTSMRRALDAAQSARDTDGPAAGAGVIAYPLANQVRMIGTAYLWSGDNAKARTELESALRLLARDYVSVAHIAATRADLALARLRDGDLDGAADTLEPLLTLTSTSGYLAGAARRAEKLVEALGSARYTGSAVARRLVVQIEEFVAAQQTNGEAARTGATSERRLPE